MKLHEFTSEYTVTLCQSPSEGDYWAVVYKGESKELGYETNNYEDYEDAMSAAMAYINKEGNEELDAARNELYEGDEEDDYESSEWEDLQRER
jgi:hypothetical protein